MRSKPDRQLFIADRLSDRRLPKPPSRIKRIARVWEFYNGRVRLLRGHASNSKLTAARRLRTALRIRRAIARWGAGRSYLVGVPVIDFATGQSEALVPASHVCANLTEAGIRSVLGDPVNLVQAARIASDTVRLSCENEPDTEEFKAGESILLLGYDHDDYCERYGHATVLRDFNRRSVRARYCETPEHVARAAGLRAQGWLTRIVPNPEKFMAWLVEEGYIAMLPELREFEL